MARNRLSFLLLSVMWIGCSSTEQIEALPPSPGIVALPDSLEDTLARVSISLRTDGDLPDDVERLRLRVAEVRLLPRSGTWRSLPASSGLLNLAGPSQAERTILSSRIPAGVYDSVEVVFGDLQLEFGSNVGSRLTSADPPSTKRSISLNIDQSAVIDLMLTLNLPASLSQDAACRWYFLPFVSLTRQE